jgi:hypothetical protein
MNPEEIFYDKIKSRGIGLEHIYTNVAIFYKIPSPILKQKYKFSVVKEMYIDVLYYNKHNKKELEG